MLTRTLWPVALFVIVSCAFAQEQPVFRTATRLVEVDVVVRDKNGPVTGLTKDDFTLFDCKPGNRDSRDPLAINSSCKGKQQPIAVFAATSLPGTTSETALAATLPPGLISNRVNSRGEAVTSATVLLLDQLNTSFDHKEYARHQAIEYLRSVRENDRVAIYSLGKSLHVLQDFTDDPQKLIRAVTNVDSGFNLDDFYVRDPSLGEVGGGGGGGGRGAGEIAGVQNAIIAEKYDQITLEALRKIVQHLSGVPGRKNLIWVKETPNVAILSEYSRKVMTLLREANIAVYPVLVRSLQSSEIFAMRFGKTPPPRMRDLDIQKRAQDLGASLGGFGFGDVRDIAVAVRTAQEDSSSTYILGFYPTGNDLDGTLHQLSVAVSRKAAKSGLAVQYRKEYLATEKAVLDADTRMSLDDLFNSPIDATGIGLTAAVGPGQVEVIVDLVQVHLEHRGDHWAGSLKVAARLESNGAIPTSNPTVQTISISLTEEQLKAQRTSGFVMLQQIGSKKTGSLHIVIQDPASGATGSLRVPLGKNAE